jgi:hypothetical protein
LYGRRTERSRGIRLGACLCAAAALWAPGAIAGSDREPNTTLVKELSWVDRDNGTDYFEGKLKAAKAKCFRERKVTLWRSIDGPRLEIERGRTDDSGRFHFRIEDPGSGQYHIDAKRTDHCRRAKSAGLEIVDLQGV